MRFGVGCGCVITHCPGGTRGAVQELNVRKQPVSGGTGEGRRESRNNGPGEVGNDFWPWERKTEWWPCQDPNSGMKVLMVSSTR